MCFMMRNYCIVNTVNRKNTNILTFCQRATAKLVQLFWQIEIKQRRINGSEKLLQIKIRKIAETISQINHDELIIEIIIN